MAKKDWITPELIVLVRSTPEEAVLYGCKYGYKFDLSGPTIQNYGRCDAAADCGICTRIVPS